MFQHVMKYYTLYIFFMSKDTLQPAPRCLMDAKEIYIWCTHVNVFNLKPLKMEAPLAVEQLHVLISLKNKNVLFSKRHHITAYIFCKCALCKSSKERRSPAEMRYACSASVMLVRNVRTHMNSQFYWIIHHQ